LMQHTVDLALSLSIDDKPSETQAKLKAGDTVFRVAGLMKDSPQTQINIGLVLKEAAALRLTREPNREAWE
jgi:hypothetical protein